VNWRLTKPSGEWNAPDWVVGLVLLALFLLAHVEWW
jgi:hypothetical protein